MTLDPQVAPHAVSGRLYVFLSQRIFGEPRFGPDWFHAEPFFRIDVKDFRPGTTRILDDSAAGFPAKLSRLPAGYYRAQAVLADNADSCQPGGGAGNLYSRVSMVQTAAANRGRIPLTLDRVVAEKKFPDSKWVKPVVVKSPLLSKALHREVLERAAVVLPASYFDRPERRYPVIYSVPGFGEPYYRTALDFVRSPAGRRSGRRGIRPRVARRRVRMGPSCLCR